MRRRPSSARRIRSHPARTSAAEARGPGSGPEPAELAAVLSRCEGTPVALLGDLVLDEFAYGEIARVSREAPVLILDYKASRYAPGGGANTAANLAALGARVTAVGRVGRDAAGRRLLELFEERGMSRAGIVRDASYVTPVKTRLLAGSPHTAKQQIVRLDRGPTGQPVGRQTASGLLSRIRGACRRAAALLVADYGFGAAAPGLVPSTRLRPGIVTLDSRFRLIEYRGITAATPNLAEVEQALGIRIPDDAPRALARAGRRLLRALRARALVVTQGSRGMTLFTADEAPLHLPPFGSDEIADVTGAGDTVIGACTLALGAGASFAQAAALANVAGGLVVMKRGTATVAAAEIASALAGGAPLWVPPRRL